MGSMRLPSLSGVRESGSGERNFAMATRTSFTGTRARLASPEIEARTRPCLSAIASIVIQTRRVPSGSHLTVDSVMLENSFVKVTDVIFSLSVR